MTFQYDNRDRLIHETRVVNGLTAYDIAYTYDGLGNRLEKRDEAASPRSKTTYFYDSVPANRDPNYPTNNNRLMRYEESVDNGQGGWTLTRTVRYVYYITGHASNIIVKDIGPGQEFIWHRGLALYYTSAGQLWRAVWERWMQDAYGNVIPGTYSREKGREFYYDGPRQRYLSRALDVSSEYPSQWKPTVEPQLWTDYLGDDPYADFQVVEKWDGVNEKWYIDSQTEKLGYVPGYGTHAQQDAQTGATRYLHGDLIRSTMLTTEQGGTAVSAVSYSAFGEPVGDPGALGTRYRYAGGWGYEDDLLHLDGAPGTKPIILLHVGWRWYEPRTGRFVQRDPIGVAGGLNAYEYVRSNPVESFDPVGLVHWESNWPPLPDPRPTPHPRPPSPPPLPPLWGINTACSILRQAAIDMTGQPGPGISLGRVAPVVNCLEAGPDVFRIYMGVEHRRRTLLGPDLNPDEDLDAYERDHDQRVKGPRY